MTGWFNGQALSENAVLLVFAVVTGILSALGVVVFYKSIDLAYWAFYRLPTAEFPRVALVTYRPVITAAGLALAWWVMRRVGRGHDGMNVPDVQLAVVRRGGDIPTRPALARTAASAITIGAGGSAGNEGPVVVLAAAIGSWLGRTFRFAPSRVVVLVGCATGAAISAAFNAPLAGAFFALEEVVGTLAAGSFAPVVVSSVVAAVVSRAVFGNHPAFSIPQQYGYAHPSELILLYPLLGVLCGIIAALFVRTYFWFGDLDGRVNLPRSVVPLLGGAAVGLLVFASNGRLVGYGHLAMHADIFGRMAWYGLLALALGKILATSITLNLGGSGGVFTPSLYIGAATGGAFGGALAHAFPSLGLHPEAYALVGMGALIAGATDAPITGILLVFEMTNDYAIVVPLMLTVVICHTVARRLSGDSLYSGWLRRRGESIEHGTDRDVLAGLHVSDAYEAAPQVIDERAAVDELLEHLGSATQLYFPVVDESHSLVGVITASELGQLARSGDNLGSLLLAGDIAQPSETVFPSDSLLDAVRKMGVRGAESIPVVERRSNRLLGLIDRSHVLNLYERTVSASPHSPSQPPSSLSTSAAGMSPK
ncbi:MAG: chloride channel protein [Gemmatimonadota bacterium]|nr:chloride channel protein [Gemmatimonadota bacterium]